MIDTTHSELAELVRQGLDNSEIAQAVGCKTSYVNQLLKKHGVSRQAIFNKNRSQVDKHQYWDDIRLANVDISSPYDDYTQIYGCTDIDQLISALDNTDKFN